MVARWKRDCHCISGQNCARLVCWVESSLQDSRVLVGCPTLPARFKVAHQLGHVLQQLLPRLFRLLVSFGGPVAPRWLQEQTASRADIAPSNIDISFPNVEVAPAPPLLVHRSCSHRICRGCSTAIRQESLQSIETATHAAAGAVLSDPRICLANILMTYFRHALRLRSPITRRLTHSQRI